MGRTLRAALLPLALCSLARAAPAARAADPLPSRNDGAVVAGVLLSAVQPKNLPLVVAGAVRIDASTIDQEPALVALLVFAGIASLAIAVPIAIHLVAPSRAEAVFTQWKTWLIRNNVVVTVVLLITFGALLVGRGLRVLSSSA